MSVLVMTLVPGISEETVIKINKQNFLAQLVDILYMIH